MENELMNEVEKKETEYMTAKLYTAGGEEVDCKLLEMKKTGRNLQVQIDENGKTIFSPPGGWDKAIEEELEL